MASTIQIRVDDDLKNKSDQLFKDLGTDRNADDVISDIRGKYGL